MRETQRERDTERERDRERERNRERETERDRVVSGLYAGIFVKRKNKYMKKSIINIKKINK